jgi:DNA polymerase III epsilon subunit-like protein
MADLADLVFLDTETTGLGDNAQAIEIAIVDADGAVIFESYCRPTVPVEPGAQAIHNIGAEKLKDAPSWPEIERQVRAALEGKTVVIFNSDFDMRILSQTATAQGDEALWLTELETVCAMYAAADCYGATNSYGTISLANAVIDAGIKFQGKPHSAAGDAATTALLWKKIEKKEHQRSVAADYRERKLAEKRTLEAAQDAQPNVLNKREREAVQALKRFTDAVLEGKTIELTNVELGQLKKMGINLEFVAASDVEVTVRGKSSAFTRFIAQAHVYTLSGTPYRCYMPWQVKELKQRKSKR